MNLLCTSPAIRPAACSRDTLHRALMLICGLCGLCGCQTLGPQERRLNVEAFDQVWSTVRDEYFDPKLGGLDWETLRTRLRPRVERASTMAQARAVMRELLAALRQSHFEIMPAELYDDPGEPQGSGLQEGDPGFDIRVIGGEAVVTRVDPDSVAMQAGVRTGWTLRRVAGQALAPRLRQLDQTLGRRSTKQLVQVQTVRQRLRGPVGTSLDLVLVDRLGSERPLTLERQPRRGRKYIIGYYPPQFVWVEARRIYGDIGLVVFNAFFDPAHVMSVYNEAMVSFRDTAGLIIDLRGNLGGISDMAAGMAGWLVAEGGLSLGTLHTRHYERELVVHPRAQTYDGPVVVLVDGLTASTAEILAAGLQRLDRAWIVGTPTAGAVQPSRVVRLPNGDGFQYATANFVTLDGDVLEGVGLQPDEEVPWSREAALQGRDAALERAIEWIRWQYE